MSTLFSFIKRYQISVLFILLILISLIVFKPVINGAFLYDDRALIVDNYFIKSFSYIPQFFVSNVLRGANIFDVNLYRPFVNLVHTFVYAIFGLSESAFHLTNILIHCLNVVLVYKLLTRFKIHYVFTFLLSVLFLVHPIQAQTVSYVAGLPDILCSLFILLAVHTFIHRIDEESKPADTKSYLLIGILTVFSMFSKELAVVLLPLLITVALYYWPRLESSRKKFAIKSLIIVFALTVVYLILKFTLLNFIGSLSLVKETSLYTDSMWVRFVTFCHVIPEYARLIFFPKELFFEKPPVAYSYFDLKATIGLLTLIIGSVAAFISLSKRRVFAFSFLWFFGALVPVSGIFIPANMLYADHWLYIPLIGLIILIGDILTHYFVTSRKRQIVSVVLMLLILAAGNRLYTRNIEWADPVLFFENELEYSDLPRIHSNLAFEYMNQLKLKKAKEHFTKAIDLGDVSAYPHYHLGKLYFSGGSTEAALNHFYKGLELSPNYLPILESLSVIAKNFGNEDLSEDFARIINRVHKGEIITFDEVPDRNRF